MIRTAESDRELPHTTTAQAILRAQDSLQFMLKLQWQVAVYIVNLEYYADNRTHKQKRAQDTT